MSKDKLVKDKKRDVPSKDYRLIKDIKQNPIYKSNISKRDSKARKIIESNNKEGKKTSIVPGQLIMFDYLTPKTKEELQYYDAKPCTVFFGVTNTSFGRRVIGFNLHYYPPRVRFNVLDTIFELFKSSYKKSWSVPLKKEIPGFNYRFFIRQMKKARLDFGVRMYAPNLMRDIRPIPPQDWSTAVFTEGHFKKETREQILHYWKNKDGVDKPGKKNNSEND